MNMIDKTSGLKNPGLFDTLFSPASIAVIGASSDPKKFGSRLVANLREDGFAGAVYPINRNAGEIGGYQAVSSLGSVSGNVDLVLICVPAGQVESAIQEAVAAQAKAAVVYSAGFAETGEDGKRLQDSILSIAHAGNLRIIGPNCLGLRNFHRRMNAMPGAGVASQAGPIAFISQSGAFGNAASVAFKAQGIGFSKLASIGNAADIQHADLIRYCADDPDTSVISVFVEGVREVDTFLDAIADVASRKPIVVLKGGRTSLGQAASMSHTSSLAGDGRIWSALLKEAGANVVEGSEELFDVTVALARANCRLPRGKSIAIVTVAGGPAVVASDHCSDQGLLMPDLEAELEPIRASVAQFASLHNPVDLTGNTPREAFVPAVKAVAALDTVDGIVGICIGLTIPELGTAMIEASATKPVVTCFLTPPVEALLAEAGVANFPSVERAVRAMRHLSDHGIWLDEHKMPDRRSAVEHISLSAGNHSEADSKRFLARYDMPVTLEAVVDDEADGLTAAKRIGYPVALKVSSITILHKSDQGGVMLGLSDADTFRAAFRVMQERFPDESLLVQKMSRSGVELIIGAQRSVNNGAVVMVGIGGVLTEILNDVAFCRAPASKQTVMNAIASLRSQRLLDGYRGQQGIDRDAVAEIAARLSEIVAANTEIAEVDLNPVISWPGGAIIVDALITVTPQEPA